MDLEKLESFFQLPSGCLKRLSNEQQNENLLEVLKKSYEHRLESENTEQQLAHALEEKSKLAQALHTLENDLENANSVIESQNTKFTQKVDEYEKLSKKLDETNEKCRNLENKVKEIDYNLENVKELNKVLETKINENYNELQNKNAKVTILQEEINESYAKCQKLQQENIQLKNEACTLETKSKINNNEDRKLNNNQLEKVLNDNQLLLNSTIEEYNDKIFKLESELSSAQIALKCREKQLSLISNETNLLASIRISHQLKMDQFNSKLNLLESNFDDSLSTIENKLSIIEKFYKSQYENNLEASKKMTKFLKTMEELKLKLQKSELEKMKIHEEKSEKEQEFKKQCEIYKEKILLLEQNLEFSKSNYSLDNEHSRSETSLVSSGFGSLSNIAANTSEIMRSGPTLTNIFSDYSCVKDENVRLTNQNIFAAKQLKKLLYEQSNIKKELEEIQNERQNLLECNSALTKRLNEARIEILSLNCKLKDSNVTINKLHSEIDVKNNLKIDLNGQIQNLLLEIEKIKNSNRSDHFTTPSEIPYFNSISELQNVNVQLLEMIHQLEYDLERKTANETENSINHADLTSIDNLNNTIEIKNAEIKNLNKIIEITTQQRDMFKILYQNKTGIAINDDEITDFNIGTISKAEYDRLFNVNNQLIENLDQKILELKNLKNEMQEEKKSFREDKIKSEKTILDLNNKLDDLIRKNEFLDETLRNSQLKFQQQNDFARNIEERLSENLREKEKTFHEFTSLKQLHRGLLAENESLKLLIKNVQLENQTLIEEKSNTKPLIDQLQDMGIQLQKYEFILKSGMSSQVQDLESSISLMKNQLVEITEQLQSEKQAISQELDRIKSEFNAERTEHQKTREKLEISNKNIEKMSSSINISADVNFESKDFIDAQALQIVNLQSQIEQYKNICNSVELKLAEISENYEKLKIELVENQKKSEDEKNEYIKNTEILKQEILDLNKKLEITSEKLNSCDTSVTDDYKNKVENLLKENERISDMYSKSVLAHGESLKKLNELNTNISDFQIKEGEDKDKISNLEEELKFCNQRLLEKCKEIEKLNEKENISIHSNVEEVSLLYQQIGTLREQLNNITEINQSQSSFNENSFPSNNDEVWKLLEFTRNEKAIFQGRLEHSQAEIARLNTKCVQLYQTIKTLESNLQSERDLRLAHGRLEEIETYKSAIISQENLEKERLDLLEKLKANQNKIIELTNSLQKTESKCENLTEQLNSLQNNYEQKFVNMDETRKQLTLARQGLAHYKKLIVQLKSQLADAQKFESAVNELEKCKEIIEQLKSKDSANLSMIETFKNEIEKLKKSISTKIDENSRLENKNKVLTEKLLAKMSSEADRLQSANPKVGTKEISGPSTRSFGTLSELDIDSQVSIPGPLSRKKIPENIPAKIQNLPLKKPENIRDTVTVQEIGDKSDTQTSFDQIDKSMDLEEGELVQPNPIIFCEKRAQRAEIKPASSLRSGTTNQSSSRFGLIRNILKKDDVNVISPKLTLQPIEPPSVNRIQTILKSQIRRQEFDNQNNQQMPSIGKSPSSFEYNENSTATAQTDISEEKFQEQIKGGNVMITEENQNDPENTSNINEKVIKIEQNNFENINENSSQFFDGSINDIGFQKYDFSKVIVPQSSFDVEDNIETQETENIPNIENEDLNKE